MSTTDELVVHGTCHHDCPDSCGWKVTVRDGRAETMRGNPDHPYSKGELCPKVNRFLHRVYSPDRVLHPMRRTGPKGSGMFERISWDDALTRIAKHMKDDRDKNFVAKNDKGVTVNRWNTTGMLASSAASNESGYLTVKVARGMGMTAFDTQARI